MALGFDLIGPISLDARSIDNNILSGMPGVYLLGEPHQQGGVAVRYAGRSDEDLAGRLKQQAGYHSHFVYAYARSTSEAYMMECALYHEWPQDLKGQIHPARPTGSLTRCHRCGF